MATALISLGLIVIVGLIIRSMHEDKKTALPAIAAETAVLAMAEIPVRAKNRLF